MGGKWGLWAVGGILWVSSVASGAWTTIVNSGPSSNRVDMVFLGDGYTAASLATNYGPHINSMLNHMFSENEEPFVRYKNYFNVHRIDVVSNEDGADVPPLGIFRDTAMDASYYFDGVTARLLYINNTKATQRLNAGLAGAPFTAEMRLVTVNDTRYGGGGGTYATYAGGNSAASEIALHELGHSFSNLADEYGGNPGTYTGGEPVQVNVTRNPAGKWSQWLGYNQPGIGVIGAYEGGLYFDHGIYRPSVNSKMRSLGEPFDAIAREKIILDIYNRVNPLDSFTPNATVLIDPVLMVDRIDPATINLNWYADGILIPAATGETFDPTDYGLAPGPHLISANAFDPTDWVRINLNSLRQSVSWNVVLTPEPSALLIILLCGPAPWRQRRQHTFYVSGRCRERRFTPLIERNQRYGPSASATIERDQGTGRQAD